MKLAPTIDPEVVWDRAENGVFFDNDENLFRFCCFYLDPYCTDVNLEITKIYNELIEYEFKVWLDHYVWNCTIPRIEIVQSHGYSYIMGTLDFKQDFNEEWIIIWMLYNFSSRYPDLYIHIADNDGELFLIEFADHIPEFLDTKCGGNRTWLNNQNIVIVPNEFYSKENLSLGQSLEFIEKSSFKLLRDDTLNKFFARKVKEYPDKILESVFLVDAEVTKELASILYTEPKTFGYECIQEALSYQEDELTDLEGDLVGVKIPVTTMLWLELKDLLLSDQPRKIGRLINEGINQRQVKSSGAVFNETMVESLTQDTLQIKLKALNKIRDFVPSKLEPISEEQFENNRNDLFAKLSENNKDFDQESYNDDSDYSSDDEDAKVRKYFKDENVDIDDDDFFEFFLKEALKMDDKDLEAFRNILDDQGNHDGQEELDLNPEELKKMMHTLQNFKVN